MSEAPLKYTISKPVDQAQLGISASLEAPPQAGPQAKDVELNIFARNDSLQKNDSSISSMSVSEMEASPADTRASPSPLGTRQHSAKAVLPSGRFGQPGGQLTAGAEATDSEGQDVFVKPGTFHALLQQVAGKKSAQSLPDEKLQADSQIETQFDRTDDLRGAYQT